MGERQEGFDLVISNKVEQLSHSQTMSVELTSFPNYCDKLQFHNLEMNTTKIFFSFERNQASAIVCHLGMRMSMKITLVFC